MQIINNAAVSIDYILRDDKGGLIDQSENGQFVFLAGAQNIIPGLEAALEGKKAGDELEITIAPKDAYGEIEPGRVQKVARSAFPEGTDIQVGAQFHGAGPEGNPVAVTVTAIDGDEIKIDGNHALAGKILHFSVKVVSVREATKDELSHGHIHGPGCHH